jgi:protein-S-isoprenylcysteine O-methyltransferase Ste14
MMSHILSSSIVFTAAILCFGSFSWAFKSHFRSTGSIPAGMKLISLLSLACFAVFTVRLVMYGTTWHGAAGLILFAASLALFSWTISATRRTPPTMAFDTDEPEFLLQHGPYNYVRHPFYVSYVLFWLGTAAATNGILGWVIPALMLAVYQHAASREEQKFAASGLSLAYHNYRRRAGMFLPRVTSLLAG